MTAPWTERPVSRKEFFSFAWGALLVVADSLRAWVQYDVAGRLSKRRVTEHRQTARQWRRWQRYWQRHWRRYGVQPGVYISDPPGNGRIRFGSRVRISPGVVVQSYNHDPEDPQRDLPAEPITIEDGCWIGANATILPGVHLGPGTIVGAGAVVTRSFPEGHAVLMGIPATVRRRLGRGCG